VPEAPLDLTGSVLIAMPGMADIRFAHSVVYMCDHSDKGAMGLIVNKPAADMNFTDLLEQLEIAPSAQVDRVGVYFGGPVETGRGFVLHSQEYRSHLRTLDVGEGIALTPTLDVLEDIAAGQGPDRAMMLLGYAGWGPGQLESELARNGWLTCAGGAELIFEVPDQEKWAHALKDLGIDPALLSGAAGNA
jgi:putative transcriptional regulator